ncbi:MAG: hypothetical protein BGO90_11480, partial [Legionella sp. 40-6]
IFQKRMIFNFISLGKRVMWEKILKNCNPIKEIGFEYYDLQKNYDVSINFITQNTQVPPHIHEQEVFNYVFEGEFSVTLDAVEKTYTAGTWIHIPAGKVHAVATKTDVVLLELWKK